MLRAAYLALAGLAVWAAAAGAQLPIPAPARFMFEAPMEDGAIRGDIEITGTAPNFGGWIRWVGGVGPDSAKIVSVTPSGSNVTVVGDNPEGRWTVHMAFAADTFSGTYEGPQSGPIHGHRAAVDPTGRYDFEVTPTGGGGRKAAGRLVIKSTAGVYSGTAQPDAAPEPAQISSLTIAGSDVTIRADIPSGGTVTLRLRARSDSLVGSYDLQGPNPESGEFRAGKVRN